MATALERYTANRAAGPVPSDARWDAPEWDAAPPLLLTRWMGERPAHFPTVQAKLLYDDNYLYIAAELEEFYIEQGGFLRRADLTAHTTRIEDPVTVAYRGYTICKCGPWTQGPYLLQTLRLLEKFDLKSMGHNGPDYVHAVVEAMKLGLADRDTYYADSLFVDVPLQGLLSREYAALRRPLIEMGKASLEQRPGDPIAGRALLGKAPQAYRLSPEPVHDTTTCVVADREGNVVAATPSGWGGVLAGRTGVVLGSRLRSLNTWRGHPNCIEPGKRPRITLTPTLVLRAGKPVAAISVAGGDQQDQVTLELLLSHIEFGLSPAAAVTAPRFITNHYVGSFNQTPTRINSGINRSRTWAIRYGSVLASTRPSPGRRSRGTDTMPSSLARSPEAATPSRLS